MYVYIHIHLPTFQTCEANFSKPRIDMGTMFSLKIAQDPRLYFRRKHFLKKFDFMVFLQRSLEKKGIFECFSYLIPYISELRLNTRSIVS